MESLVSQGHSDHHYSGVPHTTRVSQCGSARNTRCNPFWCYPWWACHHKNAMRHCGQPCHIMWYGSCDVVSTAAYRVKRVIPRGCMTHQGIGTCLSVLPVGLLSKQSRPYSTVLVDVTDVTDVTDVSANATLWKILKSWAAAKFCKGEACEDTFESMPLNIGEIVSYGVMQRSRHPMAFKMNLADQDQRFFCGPYVACVACLPSTQLCLVLSIHVNAFELVVHSRTQMVDRPHGWHAVDVLS
jgi:hypothetical protein